MFSYLFMAKTGEFFHLFITYKSMKETLASYKENVMDVNLKT